MDAVVARIRGLSASGSLSDLQTLAQELQAANLQQSAPALPNALQALDLQQHSLGAAFLLEAWSRAGLPQDGDATFLDCAAQLLAAARLQHVRVAPDVFWRVGHAFKDQAAALGCPRTGILPLLSAIRTLRGSPDALTPLHADVFQLCLLSKCYNAASSLLEDDVFDVDPTKTACSPTDLLLYSYYGGVLCIGRRQYARALELLMLSVTAPSMQRSAIVLAAYKKLVLVSLIHLGHLPPLPKFAPQSVRQMAELDARPYAELSQACASSSSHKLGRAVDAHAQAFAADGNAGLVQQVVSSQATRSIQRLTQTYLTLSLADIASRAGLASPVQAELHLVGMVQSGQIHATISEQGMVRLLEDGDTAVSATERTSLAHRLKDHVRKCRRVAERVLHMHDSLAADPGYIRKQLDAKDRTRYEGTQEDLPGLLGSGASML